MHLTKSVFAAALFSTVVFAQAHDSTFQVRYASNLTSGDSVINITNTGANGASLFGPGFGGQAGNICVNVYAFSPDEQLISCCSCLITPNGLVSLSTQNDLISNTLTGTRPNSVVVKLVATATGGTAGGTELHRQFLHQLGGRRWYRVPARAGWYGGVGDHSALGECSDRNRNDRSWSVLSD